MSKINLAEQATLVFDCDGVVLDSNRIKTRAFFNTAKPFGEEAATRLVEYHVEHGGISRYRKFGYFLQEIVGAQEEPGTLEALLAAYAEEVRKGLLSCAIAPGLDVLRAATPLARWLMVSGGDQIELRSVLSTRGLSHLFPEGIYGSPDAKAEILNREIASGNIRHPGVFLGDSRHDFEVAKMFGLGFIFISEWSEFTNWRELQASSAFPHVENIRALIDPTFFS